MQNTKWQQSLSVDIDAIDTQHRAIFENLLALENAIEKHDPWHILQYLIAELTSSVRFHFAVEDALMQIVGYPLLAQHRTEHVRLAAEVTELESKLRDSADSNDLLAFFEQWYIRHVLTDDRDYATYVKKRLAASAS